MMESPTFNEADLCRDQTIYKKIKPSIDKEKAARIPEMGKLWEEIQHLQDVYDENVGKKEKQDSTPALGQKELYFLKHHLIQLRTQQYYLMDSYYPTTNLGQKPAQEKFYQDPLLEQMRFPILPRGTAREKDSFEFINPFYSVEPPAQGIEDEKIQEWEKTNKLYFDFRNKEHLYYLIKFWKEIEGMVSDEPHAPLWELLWTFDIYQNLTELSEQQALILEGKKKGKSNKEIQAELQDKLGIFHQVNYISTIYLKIINKIIESVELNYDEWLAKDYGKAWKKCPYCGKFWLRDPRRFVRKSKAPDGLTNRCKVCDRQKRRGEPYIKWEPLPPKEKKGGIVCYEKK